MYDAGYELGADSACSASIRVTALIRVDTVAQESASEVQHRVTQQ